MRMTWLLQSDAVKYLPLLTASLVRELCSGSERQGRRGHAPRAPGPGRHFPGRTTFPGRQKIFGPYATIWILNALQLLISVHQRRSEAFKMHQIHLQPKLRQMYAAWGSSIPTLPIRLGPRTRRGDTAAGRTFASGATDLTPPLWWPQKGSYLTLSISSYILSWVTLLEASIIDLRSCRIHTVGKHNVWPYPSSSATSVGGGLKVQEGSGRFHHRLSGPTPTHLHEKKSYRIFTFHMNPTGQLRGGPDPRTLLASYATVLCSSANAKVAYKSLQYDISISLYTPSGNRYSSSRTVR